MSSENSVNLQHQIKENAEDLQNYLLDLNNWEKEMKLKEKELKLMKIGDDEEFPPVRNSLWRSKKKSRHKKQKEKIANSNKDSEMKIVDEEKKLSSASDNSENEEELCRQRKKQLAILNKDKGNEFFKKKNYDSAVNCYTVGMQLDPENPLLPANRAMAFLKKEQFQAAENDCTVCLSIDETYVKAYLRRGTARMNLKKYSLAIADFSKALELEPENKQAQMELKKLTKENKDSKEEQEKEHEVVKIQDFWPQFLGSKGVEHDKNLNDTINSSKASFIDCIFPDSQLLRPGEKTNAEFSKDSLIPINVTELEENCFIEEAGKQKKVIEEKISNMNSSIEITNMSMQEPPLPPVPVTAYEFVTDWRKLSKCPQLKYKYLKQLPPERLPKIFNYSIDAEIFSEILHALSTSFLENGVEVFDYLKYLTGVGRFNTMLMFMLENERRDLSTLLDSLKASNKPTTEIDELLKQYGTFM